MPPIGNHLIWFIDLKYVNVCIFCYFMRSLSMYQLDHKSQRMSSEVNMNANLPSWLQGRMEKAEFNTKLFCPLSYSWGVWKWKQINFISPNHSLKKCYISTNANSNKVQEGNDKVDTVKIFNVQLNYCKYVPAIVEIKAYFGHPLVFF